MVPGQLASHEIWGEILGCGYERDLMLRLRDNIRDVVIRREIFLFWVFIKSHGRGH